MDWQQLLKPVSRQEQLFEYEGMGGEVILRFEAGKKRRYECDVFTVDLKLRGESTGYKAVFENGEFVAIVGSGYVIVPNCVAERKFVDAVQEMGYKIEKTERSLGRLWVVARKEDRWLFMRNAIDGSSALRVEPGLTVRYGGIEGVVMLPGIYKKHTSSIDKILNEEFTEYLAEVVDMTDEAIEELDKIWHDDVRGDILEIVVTTLPKKYVEGLGAWLSRAGRTNGAVITYVARKIFNETDASMDRKRQLFRTLLVPFEILNL